LTSTYPFWNGIEDQTQVLAPKSVTLATVLRAKGYRTAAFVGGFALDQRFGLVRGSMSTTALSTFQRRKALIPLN